MAQVNVLNVKGEVVSTLNLNDKVFAQEWNDQIMYDVVKAQMAAMRHGSSQTKNRSDVLEKIVDSFVLITNGTLSKSGTMDDLSSEFVKYQAFIKGTLTKEDLESFGMNVISFKMVGSIYNFVIRENNVNVVDTIKSKYETYLIEVVPIDNEEIMAINMATYKGGK